VRLSYNGIRFLYLPVLDWHTLDLEVVLPKRAQRIPELLRRGTELAAYAGHPCPMCRNGHLRVSAHLAPVRPDPG
jgi:hypothetical protein